MAWTWSLLATLAYAASWLIVIGALFVVPRNRKPSSATAWLMLVFLVPFLGLVIFLLIGSPKLSRRRRAQQRTMNAYLSERAAAFAQSPELAPLFDPPVPARYEPFVRLNTNLGDLPVCAGNSVTLLPDYDGAIRAITAAVQAARAFVHVEYFALALDHTTEPFFWALEQAVARGVRVRVLLDHMGSLSYPGRKQMLKRLTAAGVAWRWMLPVRPFSKQWNRPDLRNHRKIVVVDNEVGFTGSQNMIDKTYLKRANLRRGLRYVELVARVTGPVVAELNAAFKTDWYSETGELLDDRTAPEQAALPEATGDSLCQILPSGSGYDNDNNLKLFASLIHAARHTLTLTNPYFVPDDALLTAITSAAQRGVDVALITSQIGDQFLVFHAQHSYYEELLRSGVRVYQYAAPVLLHAKHMSIDDDIAVIGSSNLDMRSLTLNLEVTLVAYDPRVVADLRRVEADYLQRSKQMQLAAWQARPLHDKLYDNLARLTAALQ
jgi:cardiolipin synthase